MSKNFKGVLHIYTPLLVIKNTHTEQEGYIMINNWEVHLSETEEATLFIPKDDEVYLTKKSCPRYDGDDRLALYVKIKRISEKNNDASDFIIDASHTRMDMNTFCTISNSELEEKIVSDDYYIFENIDFEPTEDFVVPTIHPEDDYDSSETEEVDIEISLALFDLKSMYQYSQNELQDYLDMAVELEKYDIATAIRDYCKKNPYKYKTNKKLKAVNILSAFFIY